MYLMLSIIKKTTLFSSPRGGCYLNDRDIYGIQKSEDVNEIKKNWGTVEENSTLNVNTKIKFYELLILSFNRKYSFLFGE